jgi:hypothetical protein
MPRNRADLKRKCLCIECGKRPTTSSHVCCEICLETKRQQQVRYRAGRRCSYCSGPKPAGRDKCLSCHKEKQATDQAKLEQPFKAPMDFVKPQYDVTIPEDPWPGRKRKLELWLPLPPDKNDTHFAVKGKPLTPAARGFRDWLVMSTIVHHPPADIEPLWSQPVRGKGKGFKGEPGVPWLRKPFTLQFNVHAYRSDVDHFMSFTQDCLAVAGLTANDKYCAESNNRMFWLKKGAPEFLHVVGLETKFEWYSERESTDE